MEPRCTIILGNSRLESADRVQRESNRCAARSLSWRMHEQSQAVAGNFLVEALWRTIKCLPCFLNPKESVQQDSNVPGLERCPMTALALSEKQARTESDAGNPRNGLRECRETGCPLDPIGSERNRPVDDRRVAESRSFRTISTLTSSEQSLPNFNSFDCCGRTTDGPSLPSFSPNR